MKQSDLDVPLLGYESKTTNYLLEGNNKLSSFNQEKQDKSILKTTEMIEMKYQNNSGIKEQFEFSGNKDNNNNQQQQSVFSSNLAEKTLIYLDGTVYPPEDQTDNLVKNYRYTANSFFPKVLYNYFKHFQNLLILIVSIIQLFPDFTVSYYWAVLAPFAMISFFIFYKESTDDHKRRELNSFINNQSYKVLKNAGEVTIKASEIQVGDLLLIGPNQRIPVDIILLHTPSDDNGQVYVNSEQIDGKSDIQIRRTLKYTQNYAQHNSLLTLKACVLINKPSKLVNSFSGTFKHEVGGGEGHSEKINLFNTIWANSEITSGSIIGLVIHSGQNTKSQINWEPIHYKQPKLDQEMNKLSYIYLTFFIILSLAVTIFHGFDSTWNYEFVRNLLMYLSILPVSVRFCLILSKYILSGKMEQDGQLKGLKVHNRNNPEDVGRFQFMLLDKTGTITKSEMLFKKITLLDSEYTEDQIEDIKQIMEYQCQKVGACADLNEKNINKYRDPDSVLRDTFTAIAVCNNVIPVAQGVEVTYETSSQDEISLVKLAEKVGFRLIKKNKNMIQIENAQRNKESYQIIQAFPFTSEQRKMGILAKCLESHKYLYFVKGASDVMNQILPERQMPYILEQCENLGNEGLRTMIYGIKYLTKAEFETWYNSYGQPLKSSSIRDHILIQSQKNLELDRTMFLGISGVQEQVQEQTKETIEVIRESGIKIWMVTGDNISTSKQIGINAGIKGNIHTYMTFDQIKDEYSISVRLTQLDKKLSVSNKIILVLDSTSYKTAIKFKENYFFDLLFVCQSVILCNFTPSQKASLACAIKRHSKTEQFIVGVGNGANDVQMFQQCDYSICIANSKKLSSMQQAVISSDMRIGQFQDLQRLLQHYGLNVYKRSTVMLSYLVQRGLILACIQAVFSVLYDVQIQIFSPLVIMSMSTLFCICPIMCIINHFDFTGNISTSKYHREIYMYLQKNRELSTKNFLIWSFRAIFQGVFIVIFGIYMFPDHFDLQNVIFISFFAVELLNFWGEIGFSFGAIMLQLFQVMIYITVLYFDHGHFEVIKSLVLDKPYMIKIGIIISFTYFPLQLLKWLMNQKLPSQFQQTLKHIKSSTKEAIKADNENDKYNIELKEYNQKMEKQWLEEQKKINPDVENPDYIPPPEPVLPAKFQKKNKKKEELSSQKSNTKKESDNDSKSNKKK